MSNTAHIEPVGGNPANVLSDYMSEADLVAAIKKGPRTLRRWRQRRIGPPWFRLGTDVYYSRSGFLAWARKQEVHALRNK